MKRLTTLLFCGLLLAACTTSRHWIAEDESGAATLDLRGDTIEITAPAGFTAWHPERLTGDYRITYTAEVVQREGPHDRLADLCCFWAACDPEHPDDFFARSAWRSGASDHYGTLDLFFVGIGDDDNTATRFQRYYSNLLGLPDNMSRPVQQQYTDSAHLLLPNRPYRIEISVSNGNTAFSVDGERLFLRALGSGEGDGYFGLRLFSNHVIVSGLEIESL